MDNKPLRSADCKNQKEPSMEQLTLIVAPSRTPGTVTGPNGEQLKIPAHWELLPPGDAGLTRRVKSAGPSWTVQEKVGRRMFSRGVWAPKAHIAAARQDLSQERSTESYAKRQASSKQRRERQQTEYVDSFYQAVLQFLNFAPTHSRLAEQVAAAITRHATPVGSGTVARTQRIPIEQRAESAVIAWLRHQTTEYDDMRIERVKGKRREVRRMLAERSRQLLERYRRGQSLSNCLLSRALEQTAQPSTDNSSNLDIPD